MTPITAHLTHWLDLARRRAARIGLLLLVVIFTFGSLGSTPMENSAQLTATPQAAAATLRPTSPPVKTPPPVLIAPGPTPLPAEYFRTQDQSNLITIGAILLVLIILFSALSVLTAARKRKK